MSAHHSPGPFRFWHNGAGVIYINDATGREVATVTSRLNGIDNDKRTLETFANADLLGAAPDLLSACKSALRALKDNLRPGPMDSDAKEALEQAIAKVEGRP